MNINETRNPEQWNHYGTEETVKVTRARSVGSFVALIDNRSGGYEEGGAPWAIACITHGYDSGHNSRSVSESWMSAPEDWCEKCAAEADRREAAKDPQPPPTQDNTMTIQPGPFAAPEGSTEKTYQVTITTVIPMTHTDPADWDFEALLETIRDQAHGADVQSVEMTPGGAA